MKKGLFILFVPAILMLTVSSCKRNVVKGKGSSTTETRTVQQFTSVRVEAAVRTLITVDEHLATNDLSITGYQNLVPLIKTEIKGGVLRIYTDELVHINTDKDIEVRINTQSLNGLDISGAGEAVISGNVKADRFNLDVTGAGDVTIDNINSNTFIADLSGSGSLNVKGGNVNSVVYEVTGAGEVTSFPLVANNVQANITGAGDVETNAVQKLDVDITGAGNISYKGHPVITKNVTGAGSIEDAN